MLQDVSQFNSKNNVCGMASNKRTGLNVKELAQNKNLLEIMGPQGRAAGVPEGFWIDANLFVQALHFVLW